MTREHDIRHEALLQLYGAGLGFQRTPAQMARLARRSGADFTPAELLQGCLFQVGQGFAALSTNPGSGEQRFEITSAGILHWENVESK